LPFTAWTKLNELIEVRFKLKIDIEDKREAEDIDGEQMALNKDCSNITYKVDPLRVPRNACTYNGWLENCKELKLLSDKELKESYGVRESLFVAREKTKNQLYAQQEKTEHTIRRRIFETQRQRNELQWQKMKVSETTVDTKARARRWLFFVNLNSFSPFLVLPLLTPPTSAFLSIIQLFSPSSSSSSAAFLCPRAHFYLSISIRRETNWKKLLAR
jgi:Tektin family